MGKPLPEPNSRDLLDSIKFEPESGTIWMDESRMLLVHSRVFGQLRKEMITMLGWDRAKSVLMRFGYNAGCHDAKLAHRLRNDLDAPESFVVGPQLHKLEGQANVEPIELSFDLETGAYYGEFYWHDSWEAEQHLLEYGPSEEAVCWTLLGYASGYTSHYMGRQILFKETQCVACGAEHCINVGRPIEEWEDAEELKRFLEPSPLIDELELLRTQFEKLKNRFNRSDDRFVFSTVGRSPKFREVCELVHKAASAGKVTILLTGETGVGKEVLARNIHRASDRASSHFVAVNCACIPPDLIEAELFGVEKGAYTGATQSREGRFERADGGTIFLDEVIELTPRAQAALLRVLQEGEIERVGDTRTRTIDVRIVAATNENLEEAVKQGRFRSDLFFRLNVFPVHVPPLRERKEDLPLLVEHFLCKYHQQYEKRTLGLTDRAIQLLQNYDWPGNIRELENTIERGVILTDANDSIDTQSLFPTHFESTRTTHRLDSDGRLEDHSTQTGTGLEKERLIDELLDLSVGLEELEDMMIDRAMQRCDSVISHTAKALKVTRPSLDYRIKKRSARSD